VGWKDAVQAHPGIVAGVIVRFGDFTGGRLAGHILEHAANEMMRPFEVVDSLTAPAAQSALRHSSATLVR
jgi:hypothetical protein